MNYPALAFLMQSHRRLLRIIVRGIGCQHADVVSNSCKHLIENRCFMEGTCTAKANVRSFARWHYRKIGHSRAHQVLVKSFARGVVAPMVSVSITAPTTEYQRAAAFHVSLQCWHVVGGQEVCVW